MAGLYTERVERNEALDRLGTDAIPATSGEVIGAQWEQVVNDLPFWRQPRINERDIENQESVGGIGLRGTFSQTGDVVAVEPRSRVLEPDEANELFGVKDKLTFDAPVSERMAADLNRLKREELQRQDVFRRAQGGGLEWTARIGVGLAASLLDPLNIASAFIPVVGPARYAKWLAGAAGPGGRAGIRAGVGAAEGAVGAALIEPIVIGQMSAEQSDYTMADSLLNVAFGTVLGGGLHAGFGAIGDSIKGGFARQVEDLPPDAKEASLRSALAALDEGRPVDVGMFFLRQELLSGTTLGRRADLLTPERLAEMGGEPAPVTQARVMVPLAERDQGYVRYQSEDEAGRAAARIERRTGQVVEIRQAEDGGFTLARETTAEPVRGPDGSALTFPTERAAKRYADQQMAGEKVDAVPVGGPGNRAFALVRNATDQDVKAIKAEPGLVDLGRAEDRSIAGLRLAEAARAEEVRRGARSDMERKVSDIVRQDVAGYVDPDDLAAAADVLRLAVGSRGADAPDMTAEAQSLLDADLERLKVAQEEGRVAGDEPQLIEADEMIRQADATGRAFEVAASCMAGRPA